MIVVVTKGAKETKKVASLLARKLRPISLKHAIILALEGELGSGKTTFVQGFAQALGVKANVLSPTFVLMKVYPLKKAKRFKHLIHIDCYRLHSSKDLLHLGFENILKDRGAIILMEWADRVRKYIPRHSFWVKFLYGKKPGERVISYETPHPY